MDSSQKPPVTSVQFAGRWWCNAKEAAPLSWGSVAALLNTPGWQSGRKRCHLAEQTNTKYFKIRGKVLKIILLALYEKFLKMNTGRGTGIWKKGGKIILGLYFSIERQKTNSVFLPAGFKFSLHSRGAFFWGPEGLSAPAPGTPQPAPSLYLPQLPGVGPLAPRCLQPCPRPRPLQSRTGSPGCTLALAHPLAPSGAADGPRPWVTSPVGEGTGGISALRRVVYISARVGRAPAAPRGTGALTVQVRTVENASCASCRAPRLVPARQRGPPLPRRQVAAPTQPFHAGTVWSSLPCVCHRLSPTSSCGAG